VPDATVLCEYPGAVAIAWIVTVDDTAIGPAYDAEEVVGAAPLVV